MGITRGGGTAVRLVAAAWLFGGACSSTTKSTVDQACAPGEQAACTCVGGGIGAQICNEQGKGYSDCVCEDGSAGSAGQGGAGGQGGSTTDGSAGAAGTGGTCPGTAGPTMVRVPEGYCIDSTEVTNAQYKAFVDANWPTSGQDTWCSWNSTYVPSSGWPVAGQDDYPVVWVDWCDARAFCKWAGKRLCGRIGGGANGCADFEDSTRSQWYAACSAGGALTYPYGNTYDPVACNGGDYPGSKTITVGSATACVGGYAGIYDLSGNVWEWEDACNGMAGSGDGCAQRGGSWGNSATGLGCGSGGCDYPRNFTFDTVGFRCCGP